MKILQSRSFRNKVKKLNKKEKEILDTEVTKIVKDPNIGIEKKGDLRGVFVHKFKIHTVLYLLSYRTMNENTAMNQGTGRK